MLQMNEAWRLGIHSFIAFNMKHGIGTTTVVPGGRAGGGAPIIYGRFW
jgi:hypothetical protein